MNVQVIGVVGCVGDNMTDPGQAFDQSARLRVIARLSGRHSDADRQSQRIHGGVDLRGQERPIP